MPKQLVSVMTKFNKTNDMEFFLEDVMTEKEIQEIAARLEAAKMLNAGRTYTDIILTTKLSSRTIARISVWLKNGNGGYATAIATIDNHHEHPHDTQAY